jgi:hypothetical protein
MIRLAMLRWMNIGTFLISASNSKSTDTLPPSNFVSEYAPSNRFT